MDEGLLLPDPLRLTPSFCSYSCQSLPYYSDIAFYNISGNRGDDGPGLEADERESNEVEGDAATGTVGRYALSGQKDEKGHSSQYQDQGLAWNR